MTTYHNNYILVNKCQKGNLVLEYLKKDKWMYADVVPDYAITKETGALFLSIK